MKSEMNTTDENNPQDKSEILKSFVVSGVYIKDNLGSHNFHHFMSVFEAHSREEAIGKAVVQWHEKCPEHQLLLTPITLELE